MATITENHTQLFSEPNIAVVATIRRDGTPQLTPTWIDWDGENVVFNTAVGRAKANNIDRDPRVTVTVVDPKDPFRWVSVTGRAETTTEGAVEHIDKLAKKYQGREKYDLPEGEQRLIVRVRPERVNTIGA